MADYLSLEDAAAKLGVPTERLIDLRGQGQVRGFRDGTSWKFPVDEIDRLADELDGPGSSGSGMLMSEDNMAPVGSGSVIGGDVQLTDDGGSGSDVELGLEPLARSGSDVNVVASGSDGSDVALVADQNQPTDDSIAELLGADKAGDLVEIDSKELKIDEPAIIHDSSMLDAEALKTNVDLSDVQPESDSADLFESDLSFAGSILDEAGGKQSDEDPESPTPVSTLELDDVDNSSDNALGARSSIGGNVLSELDLLNERQDSGLISGDPSKDSLLGSSGLSDNAGLSDLDGDSDMLGADSGESISGIDDDMINDNSLLIADDDDDLVIDSDDSDLVISNVSDISVSGDSGINLMSPSDSGLSLESEPLDLASGSNVSSLDLGSELAGEGGSGGSDASDGSMVDFASDEEFQLSPSGIALEADIDDGSQVIEVEDSEDIAAEPVDFGADDDPMGGFDPMGGDGFDADPNAGVVSDAFDADEAVAAGYPGVPVPAGYEIPFSLLQVVSLLFIIVTMSVSGMLMTDLVRNMWTYSEPSAPVSELTNSLISLMGWDS